MWGRASGDGLGEEEEGTQTGNRKGDREQVLQGERGGGCSEGVRPDEGGDADRRGDKVCHGVTDG